MTDTGGLSAADAGGIIGGGVTLLGMIGGGIAWLANRSDRGKATREDKLQRWQTELEAQEARIDEGRTAYTEKLEGRVNALEAKDTARDTQMTALRIAFELVSSALRHLDPHNTALTLADDMLRSAFPVSPNTPADMLGALTKIEAATEGKSA